MNGCSLVASIDWDELGRIEDGNHGWRAALQDTTDGVKGMSNLSDVYVSGEGDNPEAFIFGEAPGAQEELLRRPFVGPSGRVMRDLMAIAGLRAGRPWVFKEGPLNCWLTNTVKFRPPRNRRPTPLEIKAARPWLSAEWKAVGKPRLIIPVGGVALEAITGRQQSILVAAGKCHNYRSKEGRELFIWPMVHPSYGLRGDPQVQELLEQDWENLDRKSVV